MSCKATRALPVKPALQTLCKATFGRSSPSHRGTAANSLVSHIPPFPNGLETLLGNSLPSDINPILKSVPRKVALAMQVRLLSRTERRAPPKARDHQGAADAAEVPKTSPVFSSVPQVCSSSSA